MEYEKRRLMTKRRIAFAVAFLLLVAAAAPVLASSALREFIYKELSFRLITDRVVASETDPERIIVRLNEYISENTYPGGGPSLDTNAWNDLVRGIGWCDQVSWMLGTLLSTRDIPGRIMFINGDVQPIISHTMAEVYVGGDWRLLDPLFGLVFRTPTGTLATLPEASRNWELIKSDPKVRGLQPEARRYVEQFYEQLLTSESAQHPGRWAPLDQSRRATFARDAMQDALDITWRLVGEWGALRFQDVYLGLLRGPMVALDQVEKGSNRPLLRTEQEDPALFAYYRARNYHLYERTDLAQREYETILATYPKSGYVEKASYFLGLLELNLRRNPAGAIDRFTAFLDNYPESPWLSLAHEKLGKAYEQAGNSDEAQRHYNAASDNPYVDAAARLSVVPGASKGE